MFSMDLVFLLIIFSIMSTTFGLGFVVASMLYREIRGPAFWGSGLLLLGIGLFAIGSQGSLSGKGILFAANLTVLSGIGLAGLGSRKFLNEKSAERLYAAVIAAACLLMAIVIFIAESIIARILIISAVGTFLCADICIRFSIAAFRQKDKLFMAIAGLYGVVASAFIVRIVYRIVMETTRVQPLPGANVDLKAFICFSIPVIFAFSVMGYLMMIREYNNNFKMELEKIMRVQ